MAAESSKTELPKFPLRLMPSIRQGAEEFSKQEGVSLNQFINVAVAEKLAYLRNEAWIRGRGKPTPERIARALEILDICGDNPPEPGDELPEGYIPKRKRAVTAG